MSIVEKAVDKLRGKAQELPAPHPDSSVARAGATALPRDPTAGSAGRRPSPSGGSQTVSQAKVLSLDIAALREQGLFPTEAMEAQLLEEYRRIKRPLLAMLAKAAATASNRIMVTSALAGEGKTFTSINLALSLAQEHDISVLLVDTDVVRPTITRALGLAHRPGLLDLLSEPAMDPSALVVPTDWGGLSVVPAGQSKALMTELLSSARTKTIFSSLEHQAGRKPHLMILDSPPLLAASESSALAGAVGSVIMVVKAGETTRQQVTSAIELLEPDKNVSFILNQTRRSHGSGYYGNYYGYYHRQ